MGTLTERGRGWLKVVLEPPGRALIALHVSPDAITLIGTIGVSVAALWLVPRGMFWQAVVVATFFAFADALDGTMARLSGRASSWGAFLDSTMDRITDAAVFAGVAWYYLRQPDDSLWAGVAVAALVGAFLVSYARARAESLGFRADVGIAERTERLVLIGLGLLIADVWGAVALDVTISLIALLSWITVGQRMWVVRKQSLRDR